MAVRQRGKACAWEQAAEGFLRPTASRSFPELWVRTEMPQKWFKPARDFKLFYRFISVADTLITTQSDR